MRPPPPQPHKSGFYALKASEVTQQCKMFPPDPGNVGARGVRVNPVTWQAVVPPTGTRSRAPPLAQTRLHAPRHRSLHSLGSEREWMASFIQSHSPATPPLVRHTLRQAGRRQRWAHALSFILSMNIYRPPFRQMEAFAGGPEGEEGSPSEIGPQEKQAPSLDSLPGLLSRHTSTGAVWRG